MTDVRIITEPLGGSALSRLIQEGRAPSHWTAARPASAAEWRERAQRRRAEPHWAATWSTLAPAIQATGAAAERLARVQREGGVVVTTGQQPGLFGGPVYTWSKAMSAIALADALEEATGIPTAPLFWAATDDADFAEASSTVVARVGGCEVVRARDEPPAGTPMSHAPLGDLEQACRALREAAGSVADPRALEAALMSYGVPSRTVGDAFVLLMRELLAPLGMAVIDASHPAVLEATRPTLDAARRAAHLIEPALEVREEELRDRGLAPQVESVHGLSLVFVRERGIKRRLSIAEAAKADGNVLTPNVLLRPIVEQAILPTVAYVAGPGELAYFAQVSAVAEVLRVPAPLALPRWSCTLIEPKIAELLARYGVSVADLAAPDLLEGRLARETMRNGTASALAALRVTIAQLPEALSAEAASIGLAPAVQGAMQGLLHRVDRLERRLVAGIKRREKGRMRDVGTLRGALFPLGVRQERALNLIPTLARHGLELLSEMRRDASAHAASLVEPARGARTVGSSS
jgi:uncharacterized protein YllA (UPF0747 family)